MTTGLRWFVGFGIVFVMAACSAELPPSAPPSAGPPSASPATPLDSAGPPSASASPTIASPNPEASAKRRVTGRVIGSIRLPSYQVDLPAGWSSDGHFATKSTAAVVGVSVWEVTRVPTDPCHWKGHLVDPGPTVDDLARAFAAQALRNATPPTDVTLDGHDGKYLQWSVPTGMVVTGDADFARCDIQAVNGHRDFVSFVGSGDSERYQQVAGQVDWLWVLDVDGHRLVVDATYSPDAIEVDRAELSVVAASLHFELP